MQLSYLLMWSLALVAMGFCIKDIQVNFLPKLNAEPKFQHLTIGVCFLLFLLWSADAGIIPGLSIHFLALTCVTLMYGWRVAYLLCWPVTLALVIFDSLNLELMGQYLILSCLTPILTSYGIFLISYRCLPRNIFVYIFIAGFINGAISGSLQLLVSALFFYFDQLQDWKQIVDNYLVFTILLAFPEGMLNGMAIAILTVFKPEWLRTFSDRDYIYNHYHKK